MVEEMEPTKNTEKGMQEGEDEHLEGECDVLVMKGRESFKKAGVIEQVQLLRAPVK